MMITWTPLCTATSGFKLAISHSILPTALSACVPKGHCISIPSCCCGCWLLCTLSDCLCATLFALNLRLLDYHCHFCRYHWLPLASTVAQYPSLTSTKMHPLIARCGTVWFSRGGDGSTGKNGSGRYVRAWRSGVLPVLIDHQTTALLIDSCKGALTHVPLQPPTGVHTCACTHKCAHMLTTYTHIDSNFKFLIFRFYPFNQERCLRFHLSLYLPVFLYLFVTSDLQLP